MGLRNAIKVSNVPVYQEPGRTCLKSLGIL
jgi:hypothetical protein